VPFIHLRVSRIGCYNPDYEEHQSSAGKDFFLPKVIDFPLLPKMRRAVRDYKYEVNEGRMTEECIQYITQLQKDWERHRVKLGVEALRKEVRMVHASPSEPQLSSLYR
jgi:hypothetical protein